MLKPWKQELSASLGAVIRERFGLEHEPVAEFPPRRELGDLAFPAALHLARTLKRKPREIASEIAAAWTLPEGVRELRIEGAGYLNVCLDRSRFAARALAEPVFAVEPAVDPGKVIVEHTNINPNK
ncbi:MAG: hypothetical protein R2862_11640, partial [Thermoanaerobaculia bacterium]